MHPLARWAARLYPRWWRERYGEEFAALLEDTRPGWRGAADIAAGALAMHASSWRLKHMMAAGAAMGLVGALAAIAVWPVHYSGGVRVSLAEPVNAAVMNGALETVMGRTRLAGLMRELSLYEGAPGEDQAIARMRRDIRVIPEIDGSFQIWFRYPGEAEARTVAERLGRELSAVLPARALTAIPSERVAPNWPALLAAGLAGGAALGGVFSVFLLLRRPTPLPAGSQWAPRRAFLVSAGAGLGIAIAAWLIPISTTLVTYLHGPDSPEALRQLERAVAVQAPQARVEFTNGSARILKPVAFRLFTSQYRQRYAIAVEENERLMRAVPGFRVRFGPVWPQTPWNSAHMLLQLFALPVGVIVGGVTALVLFLRRRADPVNVPAGAVRD